MAIKKDKIFVIGEIMLDSYWHTNTTRLSPEAPVPVCLLRDIESQLGGAGNTALNIKSIGGNVELVSVVGDDQSALELEDLLLKYQIKKTFLKTPAPTITKIRIFSGHHYVTRVDIEKEMLLRSSEEMQILTHFYKNTEECSILCISDYGKGLISEKLCQELIKISRDNNIFVIIDPKRYNLNKYQGANLICPNTRELCDLTNSGDETRSAEIILDKVESLLITKSENGATLYNKNHLPISWPTYNSNPVSVIGAGDALIAGIAYYLNLYGTNKLQEAIGMAMRALGEAMKAEGTIKLR